MDTLPQLTKFTDSSLVLGEQKHVGGKVVDFEFQKLFPITLEQAVCNYELLEQFVKSVSGFVNDFKFNESCSEGRKVFLWAWDVFIKAKELLEFYDCVSDQLESGVVSESVKLEEAI